MKKYEKNARLNQKEELQPSKINSIRPAAHLAGGQVDDLKAVADDAHAHDLLACVAAVEHECIDHALHNGALGVEKQQAQEPCEEDEFLILMANAGSRKRSTTHLCLAEAAGLVAASSVWDVDGALVRDANVVLQKVDRGGVGFRISSFTGTGQP